MTKKGEKVMKTGKCGLIALILTVMMCVASCGTPADTDADSSSRKSAVSVSDITSSAVQSQASSPKNDIVYPDSDVIDITDQLEDLGMLGAERWDNSTRGKVVSRNSHDMIVFDGRLFITCGSFQDNTGPVAVYYYTNEAKTAVDTGSLQTEQNDELFIYDDTLFALSTDQKEWMVSDVYYLNKGEKKFNTAFHILNGCYHCFDMEKYHGSYFFAGCSVTSGNRYKPSVFKLDGDISKATQSDVKDLKIFDSKGVDIGYNDPKQESAARFYELFTFNDTLYGIYSTTSDFDRNGLYRYDEKTQSFVQLTDLNVKPVLDSIFTVTTDASRVSSCFTYGGKQYFLTEAIDSILCSTSDLKNYDMITTDGTVTDIIFRDGIPYLLTVKEANGGWVNTVYKTEDFIKFDKVHSFRSNLYARRFECLNGVYYFGLGLKVTFGTHNNGSKMPEHYEECGKILRYVPK